jgi:hypothetical protein
VSYTLHDLPAALDFSYFVLYIFIYFGYGNENSQVSRAERKCKIISFSPGNYKSTGMIPDKKQQYLQYNENYKIFM